MQPLPRLSDSDPGGHRSCDGDSSRCKECVLYKSRCRGCEEVGRRDIASDTYCLQGSCFTECNSCGGAKGTEVPTICCKSPLLRSAFPDISDWSLPRELNTFRDWHTAPNLPLKGWGVVATQGSPNPLVQNPYSALTEAIAVPLRHLWSPERGWRSGDLKDYLRIDPEVHLISTTMTKDDFLETLWAHDMHGGDDFYDHGIDAVMPVMFSTYYEKGNLSNFFDSKRAFASLKLGRSDFIPMVWSKSLICEDIALEAAKTIKNAVFNAQFLFNDDTMNRKLKDLLYWHFILPPDVEFYLVGMTSFPAIVAFKKMLQPRKMVFISVSPWFAATRSKRVTISGKEKKVDREYDMEALLWENQENFINACNNDVSRLRMSIKEKMVLQRVEKQVARRRGGNWL